MVAKEFLYYATKALGEDITPYIHIQGAHAHQFQSMLLYPIGRLKNLVHLSIFIVKFIFLSFDLRHDILLIKICLIFMIEKSKS